MREATRLLVSPVTTQSPARAWSEPIGAALATVAANAGTAPIGSITMQFKGDQPTVTVFTGKPTGGEDRKFIVDARTGALVRTETYADKPFLNRLHSGEAFGDGGLVVAMAWALTLIVLTITGLTIYIPSGDPVTAEEARAVDVGYVRTLDDHARLASTGNGRIGRRSTTMPSTPACR